MALPTEANSFHLAGGADELVTLTQRSVLPEYVEAGENGDIQLTPHCTYPQQPFIVGLFPGIEGRFRASLEFGQYDLASYAIGRIDGVWIAPADMAAYRDILGVVLELNDDSESPVDSYSVTIFRHEQSKQWWRAETGKWHVDDPSRKNWQRYSIATHVGPRVVTSLGVYERIIRFEEGGDAEFIDGAEPSESEYTDIPANTLVGLLGDKTLHCFASSVEITSDRFLLKIDGENTVPSIEAIRSPHKMPLYAN